MASQRNVLVNRLTCPSRKLEISLPSIKSEISTGYQAKIEHGTDIAETEEFLRSCEMYINQFIKHLYTVALA